VSSQAEYAGTAGSGNFGGTGTWSNLAYAQGAPVGGDYATAVIPHGGETKSLDLYNFTFSIPAGATINGIAFAFTAYDSGATVEIYETFVEVGGTAGNFTANGLAGTPLTTTAAGYTTGSSTDLCGLSAELTVANVNSNVETTGITIGVIFENTSPVTTRDCYVQGCQCTVYYTAPAGGAHGLLLLGVGG
jgi:hypothetical protein